MAKSQNLEFEKEYLKSLLKILGVTIESFTTQFEHIEKFVLEKDSHRMRQISICAEIINKCIYDMISAMEYDENDPAKTLSTIFHNDNEIRNLILELVKSTLQGSPQIIKLSNREEEEDGE